jgi:hypothetical protein
MEDGKNFVRHFTPQKISYFNRITEDETNRERSAHLKKPRILLKLEFKRFVPFEQVMCKGMEWIWLAWGRF